MVVSNIICAFFGGLPTATYSQNVGIVSTTKVVSRVVIGIAAVILLVAGIMPKIAFILSELFRTVYSAARQSLYLQ